MGDVGDEPGDRPGRERRRGGSASRGAAGRCPPRNASSSASPTIPSSASVCSGSEWASWAKSLIVAVAQPVDGPAAGADARAAARPERPQRHRPVRRSGCSASVTRRVGPAARAAPAASPWRRPRSPARARRTISAERDPAARAVGRRTAGRGARCGPARHWTATAATHDHAPAARARSPPGARASPSAPAQRGDAVNGAAHGRGQRAGHDRDAEARSCSRSGDQRPPARSGRPRTQTAPRARS